MCNINCIIPPHIMTKLGYSSEKEAEHLEISEKLHATRDKFKGVKFGSGGNKKFRVIQNANNQSSLQGEVARREGDDETGDPAIDETYEYTGDVYDFFKEIYNRNSIDNEGMRLMSTVHYGKKFDNAFWNGRRMVFGDGDGVTFQRFTKCLEIIGHEMAHGVVNTSVLLNNEGQSGALSESIADVFGLMVKQKKLEQRASEASWILGEGLFTNKVNGVGVRHIKNPGKAYNDALLGKDPCPSSMDDYVNTKSDNGGIHINCTIPSHAFYLASIELGGFTWNKMGRVWYNTVKNRVKDEDINFKQFAELTLLTCQKIFSDKETNVLERAWEAVKIL